MSPKREAGRISGGRKILFYTDARQFGGHDVASLHLLGCMLGAGYCVCSVFRASNRQWQNRLEKLKEVHAALEMIGLETPPLKYPDLAMVFYSGYLGRLHRVFEEFAPDLVFVSQGHLASSWAGLRIAREAGIPALSYLPMAQPLNILLGAKGWLRRFFSRRVVHWPNRWLTCTEAQEKRLRGAGATQPIARLPNPISMPAAKGRAQARAANRIPHEATVIGMAGRLNNRQKGCDLLVDALVNAPEGSPLREAWLLFIGDGEVAETMRKRLERAGWAERLRFTGWTDAPWEHYAALDLLVMPSRFEGQPLVMQEALLCGVPVCGTAVDGLADYLPSAWLCRPGDALALRRRLETMVVDLGRFGPQLVAARERIERENDLDVVAMRLESALAATVAAGA
ncbi:MAG: glycosyltransferase [Verrucomicrobia bacterium]|jgi:glycosyltransferase involved in cell wall biosynthesis|nr:glycosyltransferase [Verrucomicrobiota bacterium]